MNNRKLSEDNYISRNNNGNNIMLNTYQNINHRYRINDNYSSINSLKNSENLYQNTYNPKRKLYIHTQPESTPLTLNNDKRRKYRNFSEDNDYYRNGINNTYGNRDNVYNNNKKYLRFNNGRGVNREMDILLENN